MVVPPPTSKEFDRLSSTVSSITAIKKIDLENKSSWNNVLKNCCIEILYNRNITEKEFKNEIFRLQKDLGRIPGYYDMVSVGKYSPESYTNKYGSYIKALNILGFNYDPQNKWYNQTYTISKDGNKYKSKFESLIADILFSFKSQNIIKNYIYEYIVCNERKWTCDFFITSDNLELWLEADGLGKNRPNIYNSEHEKIKYYVENNKNFYILSYKNKNLTEHLYNIIIRSAQK